VRYPITGKITGFTKTLSHSYGKGDSEEEGGFDLISMEIPLGITSRGSFLFLSVFFFVCFVLHSTLITPLLSLLLFKAHYVKMYCSTYKWHVYRLKWNKH